MVAVDQATGERRPTSGAFKPDDDGVSVYQQSVLRAHGLGPADLVRSSLNLVVEVLAGDLRTIDLDVRPDPWPGDTDDPGHPRNAAHALIVGMERLGKKARLNKQRALVRLASIRFAYPED
jgi:hypothetical protein